MPRNNRDSKEIGNCQRQVGQGPTIKRHEGISRGDRNVLHLWQQLRDYVCSSELTELYSQKGEFYHM